MFKPIIYTYLWKLVTQHIKEYNYQGKSVFLSHINKVQSKTGRTAQLYEVFRNLYFFFFSQLTSHPAEGVALELIVQGRRWITGRNKK